jgi:hypothetical protein
MTKSRLDKDVLIRAATEIGNAKRMQKILMEIKDIEIFISLLNRLF